MSENTKNLDLYLKNPVTDGNDTFNIETMINENFRKIDMKVATKQDLSTANKVKDLGFRGLSADSINGVGGPDGIEKYPVGISGFYTDRTDWSVFLNMSDFNPGTEFLFIETHKTEPDGKINAVQEITRYKKETTSTPVKLIEKYNRVWYSDAQYTGWSNAEKVASAAALATHLVDNEKHVTTTERTNWNGKYSKPANGIPKADLVTAVQTSLGKADGSVQENTRNVANGFVGVGSDGLIPASLLGGALKTLQGSYAGDNTTNRFISLGITPKLVLINAIGGGNFIYMILLTNHGGAVFRATTNQTMSTIKITNGGIIVSQTNGNDNSTTFEYTAFY